MFLLACRILCHIVLLQKWAFLLFCLLFWLCLDHLHDSQEWIGANGEHSEKWSHRTLTVHRGWLIDSIITCLQNNPTGPGNKTSGGPGCIRLHLIELEINGLSELGRCSSSAAFFITSSISGVPEAHWCLIWNLLHGLETAPLLGIFYCYGNHLVSIVCCL